ncbi:MAG: immunoglobulin domain-containing protein [Smithella sp.]|nr:immunoglobulin domain-containing protein [Smithella sp.]
MKDSFVRAIFCLQIIFISGIGCGTFDTSPSGSFQLKRLFLADNINSSIENKVILSHPISQSITEGESATLSVVVYDAASCHFQWFKDGTALGTDSAKLIIDSAHSSDSGNYTVIVSTLAANFESNSATLSVAPVVLSNRSFTFGVWMQGPEKMLNGKTIAQNYKDIGINSFVGLWKWPYETGMYAGYTLAAMQELKNAGMNVYAGNDEAAVDWINGHPEFWDIFKGYMLGDEPDMKRNSGIQAEADANTPLAWKARGEALLALDNTREVYANFGKPFAKDVWYSTDYGQTGSKESDFACYVSPTTVISSDFYGITDPWEPPQNHGVWTYGRSIRNTKKHANYGKTRPVWGFVEASAPWKNAYSFNWMYQRMPASLIMPIVWNMVINGAQGIVYFCHDFSPTSKGSYAALLEPGMPEAMKATNQTVFAYAEILRTPDIPGTSAVTNGPVNVITMTKQFDGDTYIFAMGDGNAEYCNGLPVEAEIMVTGQTGIKIVAVLNDLRSVTMNEGRINDHFEPYEFHIYKIDN